MFNANIVEIFNSIQGEGGSVPGSCFGKRQVFVRFAGCNLGCVWCDSSDSRHVPEMMVIETEPGSGHFSHFSQNPVQLEDIMKAIYNLWTNDTHSVSFTGGEPMLQEDALAEILQDVHSSKHTYLETAGYIGNPRRIAPWLDFACVDIKDHSAIPFKNGWQWEEVVENECEFLCEFKRADVKVFAKYVVTSKTKDKDVEKIIKRIRQLEVPIIIQPVTKINDNEWGQPPSWEQILKWFTICGEHLDKEIFSLSLQVHKYLNIL